MNDCELIEAVRARSEIYDKFHAGFKNPVIKEAAWKAIAQAIGGTPAECIARWSVLRDRFSRENRLRELQTRSGAAASGKPEWIYFKLMCFLKSHIRKRNSVCNLPRRSVAVAFHSIETPTLTTDDDDDTFWTQLNLSPEPEQMRETSIIVEDTEKEKTEYTVLPTYPETLSTSSSAAASLPYLGPTGRCKKSKLDDTTMLFKETLTNMNKSLSAETNPYNEPDSIIGRSVDLALKNIKTPALKLHFRKKFRDLVQECEEAALADGSL